jgi:hypothetical protein
MWERMAQHFKQGKEKTRRGILVSHVTLIRGKEYKL